jgi:hypothetical protein
MSDSSALHAFAFQTGYWNVRHQKLARRLVGDSLWHEFGGTCRAFEILGGAGNVDDLLIHDVAGSYRGSTFRRLDPETGDWLIYWADGRRGGLDPPVRGRFVDGIGTFCGRDHFEGRDIVIRFIWSEISADHARWEQAFSLDGETWEVNWIMHFERRDESAAP